MTFTMPDDATPQIAKRVELSFISDFQDSLKLLPELVKTKPGFLYMLAGVCLVEALLKAFLDGGIPFGNFLLECITLFIAPYLIAMAYAKLVPGFDTESINPKAESRVISTSVEYGFKTTLMFFLFIAPGVWYATRGCLAAVIACLEKTSSGESLKKSQELVRGHFWQVFLYGYLQPTCVWILMFIALCLPMFAETMLPAKVGQFVTGIFTGILMFASSIFQLAIFPLLVKLYVYLKDTNNSVVSPVVPGQAVPKTGLADDDSRLNPRW